MAVVSTWANPNAAASPKPAPACTKAKGDPSALNRGFDASSPPRTTPTLASKDAWTVGRGSR
jgi:hypothetical protein